MNEPTDIIKSTSLIKENVQLPPLEHVFVCRYDTEIRFYQRFFDSIGDALQFAAQTAKCGYSPRVFYVELRFLSEYNI